MPWLVVMDVLLGMVVVDGLENAAGLPAPVIPSGRKNQWKKISTVRLCAFSWTEQRNRKQLFIRQDSGSRQFHRAFLHAEVSAQATYLPGRFFVKIAHQHLCKITGKPPLSFDFSAKPL